jgi:hypothetical protein
MRPFVRALALAGVLGIGGAFGSGVAAAADAPKADDNCHRRWYPPPCYRGGYGPGDYGGYGYGYRYSYRYRYRGHGYGYGYGGGYGPGGYGGYGDAYKAGRSSE